MSERATEWESATQETTGFSFTPVVKREDGRGDDLDASKNARSCFSRQQKNAEANITIEGCQASFFLGGGRYVFRESFRCVACIVFPTLLECWRMGGEAMLLCPRGRCSGKDDLAVCNDAVS